MTATARAGRVRNTGLRRKKQKPMRKSRNQASSAIPENQGRERGIHHSVTQVKSPATGPSTTLNKPRGRKSRQPQRKLFRAATGLPSFIRTALRPVRSRSNPPARYMKGTNPGSR